MKSTWAGEIKRTRGKFLSGQGSQWQRERDQIFAMLGEVQQRTRQIPVAEREADIEAAMNAARAVEMFERGDDDDK